MARPKIALKTHIREISGQPTSDPKLFLPVLLENGTKTELPIEVVIASAVFDPTKTHPNSEHSLAITIAHDKEVSCYYIRPSDVQKYILDCHKTPVDFERVNKKAIETLHDLKKAWVKFGTAMLEVNTLRTYRLKYPKFEEFCEKELKLHQTTVYEVMTSTMFLMQEQPEIYQAMMQGDTDVAESLPSYRSLYLIASKKKQLEKKDKYQELVTELMHGQMSTRDLQKQIKQVLHSEEEKKPSWDEFLNRWGKLSEEMEAFDVPQAVKKEAQKFLEKLKTISL